MSEGRYTLTELKFAEEKWPSPVGRVLPVAVRPTEKAAIPAYLRAMVILRPRGSVAAEVVAAVDRLSRPRWVQLIRRYAAGLLALAVLGTGVGGWRLYGHWRDCHAAAGLAREAALRRDAGDYAAAWNRYGAALAACPSSGEAAAGRARLAMDWLDNIRVTEGKETFTDIVNRVQPALSQAAMAPDDRLAADALAHLGWADFLRRRDGAGGLNPVHSYEQAIARDPHNPFAHAMWGHYILWHNGPIGDATRHFNEAVESGRERAYVRSMEIYGFLVRGDPESETELLRVVNEIRVQGEALPAGTPDELARVARLGRVLTIASSAATTGRASSRRSLPRTTWRRSRGCIRVGACRKTSARCTSSCWRSFRRTAATAPGPWRTISPC